MNTDTRYIKCDKCLSTNIGKWHGIELVSKQRLVILDLLFIDHFFVSEIYSAFARFPCDNTARFFLRVVN